MNHKFQRLVQEGDIDKVRTMFIESLNKRDDGFRREDMLLYAEEQLTDLYDVHDGEEMQSDISRWDKAYADEQKEKLKDNFSGKRAHMVTDYLQEKSFEGYMHRQERIMVFMASMMIVTGLIREISGKGYEIQNGAFLLAGTVMLLLIVWYRKKKIDLLKQDCLEGKER